MVEVQATAPCLVFSKFNVAKKLTVRNLVVDPFSRNTNMSTTRDNAEWTACKGLINHTNFLVDTVFLVHEHCTKLTVRNLVVDPFSRNTIMSTTRDNAESIILLL